MSKITGTNLSSAPTKNPLLTEHEIPTNPLVAENLSVENPARSESWFATKDPPRQGATYLNSGQQQARPDLMGEATDIEDLSVEEMLKTF